MLSGIKREGIEDTVVKTRILRRNENVARHASHLTPLNPMNLKTKNPSYLLSNPFAYPPSYSFD